MAAILNRMNTLSGANWTLPGTVAGFADSPPNRTLLAFAEAERAAGGASAVDVGCGAARNLVPLAERGWTVVGVDLSRPMLEAAAHRIVTHTLSDRATVALGPMDALPVA